MKKENISLSKGWFLLSIFALVLAGLFSLVLVIGRAPGISRLIYSPSWAKKCLVIHVNLALGVWFFSFFLAVWNLKYQSPKWGYYIALLGVFLFAVVSFFLPGNPILSNYIPALDQPVFQIGVFLFYLAVAVSIGGSFFAPRRQKALPFGTEVALLLSAFGYLLAFGLFLLTFYLVPTSWEDRPYFEMLFWGPGHVLQFVHLASMTGLWIYFLSKLLKKPLLTKTAFIALYGLWTIPLVIAPFLYWRGVESSLYYQGFTYLMRWGTWPPVAILWVVSIIAILRHSREKSASSPLFWGFFASSLLTLVGFILGAMISQSTTLIPAHYHAAIGAVTLAYMAMTYELLFMYGYSLKKVSPFFLSLQPALFGAGQAIFALGFAYGGIHGLARKVYGQEQHIRTAAEYVGLAVMGIGGALAICGGILFLLLVGKLLGSPGESALPLEEVKKESMVNIQFLQ